MILLPGIICVYPFGLGRENWKIARFVYYGLLALQHRGESLAFIATLGREFNVYQGEGLVDEVFDQETLSSMDGFVGVGMVSPNPNSRPVIVDSPKRLVLVWDGSPLLEKDNLESWRAFGEMLSEEINRCNDSLEATTKILEAVEGGFSFIAMTEDQEVIIARDKRGVKPLEVGSLGFDLGCVSSETSSLDVLGMEHSYTLGCGEVLRFDPHSISRGRVRGRAEPTPCSFEYVYLARPDSILNNIPVYRVRERIGENLAKENPIVADVVIGVPDTAVPFAIGYSKSSGIPFSLGFVSTGRKVRSALKPTFFERIVGVQLKLNPITSVVDGRDVILIDDSVVRGTTLKNTIWNLKRRGACRVHVLIGSPPLTYPCPYGEEIPPPDELIAKSLTSKEIAQVVGADTFNFLSIEGLLNSINLPRGSPCLTCWYRGG